MGAARTKQVKIDGIKVNIPVGSLDKPSDETQRITKDCEDPRGWKYPQKPYYTYDLSLVRDLCYCYDFYLGGHEVQVIRWDEFGTLYRVTSKGYYHYIGA
ncbi:MAG: hypothetical protein KGL39_00560 [Patescibacteria group bacterium]|nr:hypothetical protein [Patescibacteria group bacterium]